MALVLYCDMYGGFYRTMECTSSISEGFEQVDAIGYQQRPQGHGYNYGAMVTKDGSKGVDGQTTLDNEDIYNNQGRPSVNKGGKPTYGSTRESGQITASLPRKHLSSKI